MSEQPFNPIKIKEDKIRSVESEDVRKSLAVKIRDKISTVGMDGQRIATGSAVQHHAFDFERKSEFLRLAIEFWPNLAKISAAVGVDPTTVWNHRKSDPVFNNALQDIDSMVCDEMEQTLRTEGMKPKGFLDRMAYLRAHRPELYDRAKVVKIEGYKMNSAERSQRIGAVDTAIDAEIVKTYLDRKQRRELKQQQRLGGAGESGGEKKAGVGDETKA